MMGADGFIQAYNAPLAVDDAHQVIVACGVTDPPSDAANFAPMLERVRPNAGAAPEHATGDTGYWNPHVKARALGTEAWVATARVRQGDAGPATRTGDPPDDLDPRERMRWRLDTSEGRTRYARRKAVVEPVNGQSKRRPAVPAVFPARRGWRRRRVGHGEPVSQRPEAVRPPGGAGACPA